MKRSFRAVLLPLLALGACRSGTEPPGAPADLQHVSGGSPSGVVGAPIPDSLQVQVVDGNGRAVPGQIVTWTVGAGHGTISPVEVLSDRQGVARAAWILGVGAGAQLATARIVTEEGPRVLEFTATAAPGPVWEISVSPSDALFALDETRQFEAVRRDAHGNAVTRDDLEWSVSDPAVAAVDAKSGLVRGVGAGTALLTATSQGRSATANVTVAHRLSLLAASETSRTGTVGAGLPQPLVVKVVDAKGRSVQGQVVTWVAEPGSGTVTPAEVATDAEGIAQAVWTLGTGAGNQGAGAQVVNPLGTATVRFDAVAEPGPVATITVSPDALDLVVGETRSLAAVRQDAYGNTITGGTVSWASSSSGVAAIDQSGGVRGAGVGSAVITASSGGKSGTVAVSVAPQLVFEDGFDAENQGLAADNYISFARWDVIAGSVDLVGAPPYDDFLPPGNGIGVDLDGTSRSAGTLRTKETFTLVPGTYQLSFQLAGCPRPSDPNTVVVSLGSLFEEEFTLAQYAPLTTYSFTIQVTSTTPAQLVFKHLGGDDYGILLDNVRLDRRQ